MVPIAHISVTQDALHAVTQRSLKSIATRKDEKPTKTDLEKFCWKPERKSGSTIGQLDTHREGKWANCTRTRGGSHLYGSVINTNDTTCIVYTPCVRLHIAFPLLTLR